MGRRATKSVDLHVGQRLRLCRQNMGLSRDELASIIGAGAGAVGRYERGLRPVGAALLLHLCEIFGVNVTYFFDGLAATAAAAPPVPDQAAVEETARFIDAFYAIDDPGVRRRLIKLVKAAAG